MPKSKKIKAICLFTVFLGLVCAVEIVSVHAQETLTVTIDTVATSDVELRGFSSAFPFPILSVMTISDPDGDHVSGLANKSDWIGPESVAESGRPITRIWQPIVERYPDSLTAFGDTDLYVQRPAPQFMEICESCDPIVPTSTVLLIDVSSSIEKSELDSAKRGVTRFIRDMRPEDRAGVLLFADTTETFPTLPITGNTDSLISFIDAIKETRDFTPLYRAMVEAIELTKHETALRRAIVIYTDGESALPRGETESFTPDSVIVKARKYAIPIHTIALGNRTDLNELKRIARETGGRFFHTEDGTEFEQIYGKASNIIQNFYVMAHTSAFPCNDGLPRIVQVTVNDSTTSGLRVGTATGSYALSGIPNNYDLQLSKSASRDSVQPGQEIRYTLRIDNLGPHTAYNYTLSDSISQHLIIPEATFSKLPNVIENNVFTWRFDSLAAFQTEEITYTASVPASLPDSISEVVSSSTVMGPCDTRSVNDITLSRITIFRPPRNYDLQLTKSIDKDTVHAEETFQYELRIENLGPNTASGLTLIDSLPDFITINRQSFNRAPDSEDGNLLIWQLDSLTVSQDTLFTFSANVAASLADSMMVLVNSSIVDAPGDTNATNNLASAIVVIRRVPKNYDLQLTKTVDKDTVRTEETFQYELRIENLGPNTASGLTLIDSLPDFITINRQSFNREPDSDEGNLFIWQLDSLTVSQDTLFTFSANVAASLADSVMVLVNSSIVDAPLDTNATNNLASAFVVAIEEIVRFRENCQLFTFDHNVFEPAKHQSLRINFELESDQSASLELYDVSGYRVSTLTSSHFVAGSNTFDWNGMTENGQKVGSGVYIVALRANKLICWKKVIVVQ